MSISYRLNLNIEKLPFDYWNGLLWNTIWSEVSFSNLFDRRGWIQATRPGFSTILTKEKAILIMKRTKTVQSREKSYGAKRRWELECEKGDILFVKVSSSHDVVWFKRKVKLNPRYNGPFEILERVGTIAHPISLSRSLSSHHNVFHIPMLRKDEPDLSHVLDYEMIKLREDLTYVERSTQILDQKEQVPKQRQFHSIKIMVLLRKLRGRVRKKSGSVILSLDEWDTL